MFFYSDDPVADYDRYDEANTLSEEGYQEHRQDLIRRIEETKSCKASLAEFIEDRPDEPVCRLNELLLLHYADLEGWDDVAQRMIEEGWELGQ